MSQAVVKYVFAALIALLSTQPFVPSARLEVLTELAWAQAADQQNAEEIRRPQPDHRTAYAVPVYQSCVRPEPALTVQFQRPPPVSPLTA